MAETRGLIEPFSPRQVKHNGSTPLVSYGTSSYGYDVRCSDEFKIFTNINSAVVDPKSFDEDSFVDFKGDVCIVPAQFVRPGQHRRVFPHSPERADDMPGQIDLCPLRHHRQRDAAGTGMGGARYFGVFQYLAAAGEDLCQ